MAPQDVGKKAPQGGEDAVFPIQHNDMTMAIDCPYNLAGHLVGLEHHGATEITTQQIGIDKARADVGKADFQAAGIGLLFKGLQIRPWLQNRTARDQAPWCRQSRKWQRCGRALVRQNSGRPPLSCG